MVQVAGAAGARRAVAGDPRRGAAAQGEIALEEAAIMAEAQAAAATGNIAALLAGLLAMQASCNARIGSSCHADRCTDMIHVDQVMMAASQREQAALINLEHVGGAGATLAAPVERSAE